MVIADDNRWVTGASLRHSWIHGRCHVLVTLLLVPRAQILLVMANLLYTNPLPFDASKPAQGTLEVHMRLVKEGQDSSAAARDRSVFRMAEHKDV